MRSQGRPASSRDGRLNSSRVSAVFTCVAIRISI